MVFPVPSGTELPEGKPYADECVVAMAAAHGAIARLPPQMLSPPETRLCLLAALLLPLREVTVPAKKKRVRLTSHIVALAPSFRVRCARGKFERRPTFPSRAKFFSALSARSRALKQGSWGPCLI